MVLGTCPPPSGAKTEPKIPFLCCCTKELDLFKCLGNWIFFLLLLFVHREGLIYYRLFFLHLLTLSLGGEQEEAL